MKKIVVVALAMACTTPAFSQSSHQVRGYTRKDGTYVAPHYQTNPDSTRLNNWSTVGNVNLYTGKPGTVDPYAPKAPTINPYINSSADKARADGDDPD